MLNSITFTALIWAACMVLPRVSQAQPGDHLASLPPLIDREVFFGDPEIAGAQLSPNGEFVSFTRPLDGVMNVWVKQRGEDFDSARPITADPNRPITGYFWSRDSRHILFVQDRDGDENFHVYAVDPRSEPAEGSQVPEARPLTSGENVRAIIYSVPRHDHDHIVVGLNDRSPQLHDVYRVNIQTGERELLIQNDENVAGWGVDDHGRVRGAVRQLPDGGTEILRVDDGADLTQIYTCSNEETCGMVRFHPDGEQVYMITNRGDVDLTQLVVFHLETGEKQVIENDPEGQADFSGAIFSEEGELLATYYVGDRQRIYIRDDAFQRDYNFLREQLPDGDLNIRTRTTDNDYWLVSVTSDVDPGATYLYDRTAGDVSFLYRPRPNLPVEHLAPMETVRYTARDGLEIPAYLTVPKGVEPSNLPVIIVPHGGPWARDYWGYDSQAQFLANRGYAVLQPNFRGSTGFGKQFLNAGNLEWGTGAMQHDITDGVQWLIEQGIADPERVGIYGGSYGGYATLAGLAFTPELYAAGVSFVGPSNIITLLNSIPPYWEPIRKIFSVRVGDMDDPEDYERMKEQSPLFSAENIRAPLLVVQGANDPRVKQHESDQIVVALRDLGRDVEYIVAPDEGHGFTRKPNRLAFFTAQERFFAEHLGGRYQESMSDEIRERLEEITVDINTVELTDVAEAAGDAATAELPLGQAARIQPGEYAYKMKMNVMGEEIEMDVTRTISETSIDGRPAFSIVDVASSPMGNVVDSVLIDQSNMRAVSRVVNQMGATIRVNYGDDRVTGVIEAQGQQRPIDTALEAPVFPDGGGLDVLLTALPLQAEFASTYRMFDMMSMKARPMALEVTGSETVESAAGSFETYTVELTPLDGEPGGGKMWVSKAAPHVIVKSEGKLPPQAGGGDVSLELVSKN